MNPFVKPVVHEILLTVLIFVHVMAGALMDVLVSIIHHIVLIARSTTSMSTAKLFELEFWKLACRTTSKSLNKVYARIKLTMCFTNA